MRSSRPAHRAVPIAILARTALLAWTALLGGCGPRLQPVDDDNAGAALMRNLLTARTVDVIVRDGPIEEHCAVLASRVAREDELVLRVVDVPDESPRGHARVVIGTAADPLLVILAARAGIEFPRAGCFRVLGQHFDDPGDAFIATFEDPDRAGLPVTLFFGNDARELRHDVVEPLAGWKPQLRVLHRGEPALSMPLTRDGRARADRVVRHALERTRLRRGYVELPANAPGFGGSMAREIEPARASAYMESCARAASRAAAWVSPSETPYACTLVLHAQLEDFETWTGARELARLDLHGQSVHALLAAGACDDAGAEMALLTAVRRLGDPVEEWMADAARYDGADAYLGRALASWIGWLAQAKVALSASELVDARAALFHSPHLVKPMRAALWRALIEARGIDYVRQLWRGTRRLDAGAELETLFTQWLSKIEPWQAAVHATERSRRTLSAWSVGLCVEEPAWVQRNGFGTRACDASFDAAARRGANAVALTSYALAPGGLPASAGAGLPACGAREGDVALLVAAAQARARGHSTWLLPQLLSGAAGTWSGSWLRGDEAAWSRFFADYREFALHYALLAELGGFDVLSLGTGLPETSRMLVFGRRAQPAELDWKRAGWTKVVTAARAAYAGQLTFVAASDDEAELIGFWPELDLVALEPRVRFQNAAFATREAALTAAMENLRRACDAGARVARANGRPLAIVGASFERNDTVHTPRIGPGSASDESREEPFKRLVQLVPGARDVLRGVLLGRWSTDPGDEGVGAHDHRLEDDEATARLLRDLRAAGEAQ